MQQRIIRLTLVKLFCLRTTSLNTAIYSGISRYTAKILFLRISDYLWHLGAVRLKSTRNLTPKSVSGSITSVAQSIVAHTGLAAISRHPRWFQFILLVLLFFTARSYPMAVYAIVLCPSVPLFVRPSHIGFVSKRLHVSPRDHGSRGTLVF